MSEPAWLTAARRWLGQLIYDAWHPKIGADIVPVGEPTLASTLSLVAVGIVVAVLLWKSRV